MARYQGRVKVNKVDSNGDKITNLSKWLKQNPNKLYFDSYLEFQCYTYLKTRKDITFTFHPDKTVYLQGFSCNTFTPSKRAKKDITSRKIKKGDIIPAKISKQKVQEASYTADFLLSYGKEEFFIETKGFADEAFKLRFKFFKSQLNKNQHAYVVKSLKEFKELLNLLYEKEK